MKLTPYPGYENHLRSYYKDGTEETLKAKQAQGADMMNYEVPEGMLIEDRMIPGSEEGTQLRIRIYKPAGLEENSPMIMDIHGGGWVGGNLDIDNGRCIELAKRTPAIVVGVDYRLTTKEVYFPKPLMDCYTAYMWLHEHGSEIGGDPERIGIHGTSAGGNMAGGLALYLRDNDGPQPALNVLVCPQLSLELTQHSSFQQMSEVVMQPDNKAKCPEALYLGGYNGQRPSYYAFPGECPDFQGLGAHCIIAGEYDSFRDDAREYAGNLYRTGVPCEILVAPRVGHGFLTVHHPFTDLVHEYICSSFRREFGMIKGCGETTEEVAP